jgi:HEAT repeat protein
MRNPVTAPRLLRSLPLIPAILLLLGVYASAQSIEDISTRLAQGDDRTRAQAAAALVRLDNPKAVPVLCRALEHEKSRTVLTAILDGLSAYGKKSCFPALLDFIARTRWESGRKRACAVLDAVDGRIARRMLLRRLGTEKNGAFRLGLVGALEHLHTPDGPALLARVAVTDDYLLSRLRAVGILASRDENPAVLRFFRRSLSRGSPAHRAHAAWALGRCRDKAARSALAQAASLPGVDLSFEAALALGRMADVPGTVKPVAAALHRQKDEVTRLALLHALGQTGDDLALPALLASLEGGWLARAVAATALSRFKGHKAASAVLAAAKKQGSLLNAETALALGRLGDPKAFDLLAHNWTGLSPREARPRLKALACLPHPDRAGLIEKAARKASTRELATRLAGDHGMHTLLPLLATLTADASHGVRMEAVKSLGMIAGLEHLALLARIAQDPKAAPPLRALAVQTVGKLVDNVPGASGHRLTKKILPAMEKALADDSPLVQVAGAWTLGKIRCIESVDILLRALVKITDPFLRRAVFAGLGRITGATLPPDPAAWQAGWKANRDAFAEKSAGPHDVSTEASAVYLDDLRQKGLDLLFVLDVTGSMGSELAVAKERTGAILSMLGRIVPSLRAGVVAYRDEVALNRPLTFDHGLVAKDIASLQAYGGGTDWEEGICPALFAALAEEDWRRGARKVLILVGDAPPHDPRRATLMALWAHEGLEIDVFCVAAHATDLSRLPALVSLAVRGGGDVVPLRGTHGLEHYLILYALGPQCREEAELLLKDGG